MLTWVTAAGMILGCCAPLGRAAGAPSPSGEKRIALVIGNAAYPAGTLATATNDAGLVAQALAQVGFDVTAAADTDIATTRKMFRAFLGKAEGAGPDAVIFIYLAGQGVQFDGDNFLVPVDARIEHGADVPLQATRLSDFSRAIEAMPAKARIFVYDLARANTFAKGDGMPLAGGLSLISAPKGSLYAFNAAPGTVGVADTAPYGAYAKALAEMIQTPGLLLDMMFERVRLRVGELTNGAVVPWDDAQLDPAVSVFPTHGGAAPPEAAPSAMPVAGLSADIAYSVVIARDRLAGYQGFARAFPDEPLALRVRAILAVRREALTWTEAMRANDPRAYWTYLRRYPRGAHRFDVRRRLALLHAALEPPPRFDIYDFADLALPRPDEVAFVERPDISFDEPSWTPIPPPPKALCPPPRAAFRDLPPPPLVPIGMLPIAVPLTVGDVGVGTGRVVQPDAPGYGRVIAETGSRPGGGSILTLLSGSGALISRAATTIGPGTDRTIVQTDPNDVILSRTTTVHENNGWTTTQTGPAGGVVWKIVTRADARGGQTTVTANGRNQIIATVQRNAQGIVTRITREAGSAREQRPVSVPAARPETPPPQSTSTRPTPPPPRGATVGPSVIRPPGPPSVPPTTTTARPSAPGAEPGGASEPRREPVGAAPNEPLPPGPRPSPQAAPRLSRPQAHAPLGQPARGGVSGNEASPKRPPSGGPNPDPTPPRDLSPQTTPRPTTPLPPPRPRTSAKPAPGAPARTRRAEQRRAAPHDAGRRKGAAPRRKHRTK